MERDYFKALQESAQNTVHFDTTKMKNADLAKRIRNRFTSQEIRDFTITFQSFGFKHGVPMDADMVIDVRFLPNPFYEPELRELTGNDERVYNYVMQAPETQEFIEVLKPYTDSVFASYQEQHKSHMVVAIGCTGGQHRSVSICNWLYSQYKDKYQCFKSHRDSGGDEQ